MPNQPDINKCMRSMQIPLELMARLRKKASQMQMTINQLVTFILHDFLDGCPLDDDDFVWIKKEVRKNEERNRKS